MQTTKHDEQRISLVLTCVGMALASGNMSSAVVTIAELGGCPPCDAGVIGSHVRHLVETDEEPGGCPPCVAGSHAGHKSWKTSCKICKWRNQVLPLPNGERWPEFHTPVHNMAASGQIKQSHGSFSIRLSCHRMRPMNH